MTLDELLDKTASELEKMTEEEKYEFFKPYLSATRPVVRSDIGKESPKERKPIRRKASGTDMMQKLMDMTKRMEAVGKKLGAEE